MTNKENAIKLVKQFQNCINNGVSIDAAVMACLMEMAEWKERKMIEKACEWIEENIWKHIHINTDWNIPEIDYDFFINFRKAMEE